MSFRILKTITGATIVGFGLIANASAAETDRGVYVGAGVGEATNEIDEMDFDASDTAFKVFVGYSFNKYFALEGAYVDAGSPDQKYGAGNIQIDASGFILSGLGRIPLGESFSLFAKLGYAFYDTEATLRIGNASASADESDEDLAYGIGAELNLGQRFGLRAEYEAVDVSDGSFNFYSLSGVFKF